MAMEWSGQQSFNKPPAEVADACIKACESLGFRIRTADRHTGVIYARKKSFNNSFQLSIQVNHLAAGTSVSVHLVGEERGLVQAMMGTADRIVTELSGSYMAELERRLGVTRGAGW